MASMMATRASSTASRMASLLAPGGSLISTPPLRLSVAENAGGNALAAGADEPYCGADAAAGPIDAAGLVGGVGGTGSAGGAVGVMRTPSLSIEMVTSSPREFFFSMCTAGGFLAGFFETFGTCCTLGPMVTSSRSPELRSLDRMSAPIRSRNERRKKRFQVMPTSQLA